MNPEDALLKAAIELDEAMRVNRARSINPPDISILKHGMYGYEKSLLIRAFGNETILIREVGSHDGMVWRTSVACDDLGSDDTYTPMGIHDSLLDAIKSILDSACYYDWMEKMEARLYEAIRKRRGW